LNCNHLIPFPLTSSGFSGPRITKHDSLSDEEDKGSRREGKKPFASTQKSRAAAVHNQSERKRRDK
ncbi:unnamed protein product, partial [Musa acuminata var. zebrina]